MAKIKDIFDGENLSVWEDDEFVTLSFFFATITFPKKEWEDVKKDLKEMLKKEKK